MKALAYYLTIFILLIIDYFKGGAFKCSTN